MDAWLGLCANRSDLLLVAPKQDHLIVREFIQLSVVK